MFFSNSEGISISDYPGFRIKYFIFITQIQMQTTWPEILS